MNSVPGNASPLSPISQHHTVNGSPTLASLTASNLNPVQQSIHRNDLVPIDPSLRLKIERLESALRFLGLNPTEKQHQEMQDRLEVDAEGTVAYGEFVTLAQEIFAIGLPQIKPKVRSIKAENNSESILNFEKQSQDALSYEVEMKWANRERDKLIVENKRLEGLLQLRDLELKSAESVLLRVREELQSSVDDNRSLRSRLRLVEEAQKAARRTEKDYEEVLRMLETELLHTRRHDSKKPSRSSAGLLEVEHQLKKMEVEKKMFEVATERLLQFVACVCEHLDGLLEISKTDMHRTVNGETDEDVDLKERLSHFSQVIRFLSTEAKNTTEAVQSLLEMETMSNSNGPQQTENERHGYSASNAIYQSKALSSSTQLHDRSAVQSSRRTAGSSETSKSNKPKRNFSQSYR